MTERASVSAPWWQGATIYQIYPRSFCDTTGNGVGDLPGITKNLEYVRDLGVDAIWLSPFFTSPMADFGYDVADYCDVDPLFGTLHDFDALVDRASQLGLRLIIDQVYSHTSIAHPWFQSSARAADGDMRDWYVWADAGPGGVPPTNWQAVFGGSSWTWSGERQQYYLHNFLPEQPDLNVHHPAVQDALLDVARFWLERGVSGFRLDALQCLMHDVSLRDNPPSDDPMADRPYRMQEHRYDQGHPAVADFLRRVRALTDEYDAIFTVAEVGSADPLPQMREFTAPGVLNSAYSFDFLSATRLDPDALRTSLAAWPNSEPDSVSSRLSTVAGWPSWAFSNHDAPRVASRWTNDQPNARSSKLFALLLLSLRGNVFIYQGEELGLAQADIPFEQLVDPEAIKHWPKTLGRDGARTPMPWQRHAPHAGFSTHLPWLPIASSHATAGVDQQIADPSSVLHFFRELLALRQASPALRRGHLAFLESAATLIVIRRWLDQEQWLSIINATDDTATFALPESTETISRLIVGDVQGEATLTCAPQSAALMRLS